MPSVPDRKTVLRRRALVSQIKKFGQDQFGLPKTKNFTQVNFKIENIYIVYWCNAKSFCERSSYLKSSEVFYDKKKYKGSLLTLYHLKTSLFFLASVIFHEDFHSWIAKNKLVSIGRKDEDGALEESIANLFGELGAITWLRRMGFSKNLTKRLTRGVNSNTKNARILSSEYKSLIRIYKNSSFSKEQKQALKKNFFKRNKKLIEMFSGALGGVANNASFYTARLYSKYLPLFYSFCKCHTSINNPDLCSILEKLKEMSKKSKSEKDFIKRMQNGVNRLSKNNPQ